MDDFMRRRLQAEIAANGPPEPPWARYPWLHRGSIGWRMGAGEDWIWLWHAWVEAYLTDLDSAVVYLRRHPRAPRTWTDVLDGILSGLDRTLDARARRLVVEGLVGDDVAYPVFVRNALRAGGMTAPWTWSEDTDLESAWRYDGRRVGWWARWVARECPDRVGWLKSQPPPPPTWAGVAAVVAGAAPDDPWATLDGGAERLIAVMCRDGTLPPPWVGGHPPIAEFGWNDERADNRHRWAWWVFTSFEDAATWRAYLGAAPPPPAWREALDGRLFEQLVEDP